MSASFATTFASPVRPQDDAASVIPSLSTSRHSYSSARPSSTKSRSSGKRIYTRTAAASKAPPLPVPARSSSILKQPTAETAPARTLDPLFQLPFGAPLPNMYESSASLSPSEEDSDSDAGPPTTRREMLSRRRRDKEDSTTPTTASSSGSSLRKSSKSTKHRSAAAANERKSLVFSSPPPSSKRPSSTKKASLPRAAGHQGLGVEIEGVGWEDSMREAAPRYPDVAHPHPPVTSATYTSDLGSGISTQGSSPEMPQLGQASTPLHAQAPPPPMPTPPSPSRSRASRSRHGSVHSHTGEVKAARGAPRFLSEQVDNHEHESAAASGYPTVELHPEHIVFATPSASTSKPPSRRSSTASNLRTPSLVHSPASTSQAYPETPALPSPSTYAHREQRPQAHRTKSTSSIGSSRSLASSHGQPTPSATRYATSNAYFPPPPPPKSPRRYASPHLDQEEDLGATPIAQVFPCSPRPRQSPSSSRTPSGPFPGPPTGSPHARSQRSPAAPPSTSIFPTAPRPSTSAPAPSSPATRRRSEIFPSVRQPSSAAAPPSAPWEEGSGEDELDWMVSAQRKLDPTSSPRRAGAGSAAARQVFSSTARRVEQSRDLEEQMQYEREERGLGVGFDSVRASRVEERGAGQVEGEVLDDPTPTKPRAVLEEEQPPRTTTTRQPHQRHSKGVSQSSATSGASEYASAAEEDDLHRAEVEASVSDLLAPSTPPEVAVALLAAPSASASTTTASLSSADQTNLWVLDSIANSVVNGNARRMSAIGEVSENEAPSTLASGTEEPEEDGRLDFDPAGRLNTKKLSLTPSHLLDPSKSGETTPMASTPTRASSLPPPQGPQVSSYPSALSPASLRSPYSPTTPSRPTLPRSSSATSRASLYNHSNASSLSAQTHISGHSSHRSTPTSKGSKFGKKLGAFFGGGGGSTSGERGAPSQPQGISSEQVRAWAAGGGDEGEEVLQDGLLEGGGGTDEALLLSPSEAGGKKEEVVKFESLLERFQREERERLVELKASKWAAAGQAQVGSGEPAVTV